MHLRTRMALALTLCAVTGTNAFAQLKGHYIPGFTGLDNGSQAPPSIAIGVPVYFYPANTLKDDEGHDIGSQPDINASFTGLSIAWVTNLKLFGANVGGNIVPMDFMSERLEAASLDVGGPLAFSDITVQPLQLGWHTPRADYVAGWSFFLPTGSWELGGTENSGLGMWSHDFQAGTTVNLDNKHEWKTSALATYEIHTSKKDTDLTAGNILTVEGGTGRSFYAKVNGTPIPRVTNIGLVYYGQFKVTADSGSGPLADRLLAGAKDRVFAIGGEANVFLPKQKLLLGIRVMPEFGARNRTQGTAILITLGYQAKSLMKAP